LKQGGIKRRCWLITAHRSATGGRVKNVGLRDKAANPTYGTDRYIVAKFNMGILKGQ